MLALLVDSANYQPNATAVPMFVTGTIVLVLAATAAVHERGSRVVAPFLWLAGSIVVWLYAAGAMYSAIEADLARVWAMVAHIGAAGIGPPVFFSPCASSTPANSGGACWARPGALPPSSSYSPSSRVISSWVSATSGGAGIRTTDRSARCSWPIA